MLLKIRQTNRNIPVNSVDYSELRFFFSFSYVFKNCNLPVLNSKTFFLILVCQCYSTELQMELFLS